MAVQVLLHQTGSTSVVLSESPTLTGTVTADTIKPKLIRFPQIAGAQTQGTHREF